MRCNVQMKGSGQDSVRLSICSHGGSKEGITFHMRSCADFMFIALAAMRFLQL